MPNPIAVFGSLNADLVIGIARPPKPGETISGTDLEQFPGGKGANQAYAAARLGGSVSMIGQVGDDQFGRFLIESQRDAGVETSSIGVVDGASGVAMINVLPGGENMIVTATGANGTVTADLARARLAALQEGSFLLCELQVALEAVAAALETAKQAGATTILDPAPARRLPPEMLVNVDVLTPNQTEAATLLEESREVEDFDEAAEAGQLLRRLGPGVVIMKLGRLGCLIADERGSRPVAGFTVEAVDTTAAGDTFNGALAVTLAEGRDIDEAARFANAAAALSVTAPGAQSSAPSRQQVEDFLNRAPRG